MPLFLTPELLKYTGVAHASTAASSGAILMPQIIPADVSVTMPFSIAEHMLTHVRDGNAAMGSAELEALLEH
jgi:hypothetical protein